MLFNWWSDSIRTLSYSSSVSVYGSEYDVILVGAELG